MYMCWQGKQRVVRRESVVRVELAELSAELDLDILSRLGSLSKAFSHCPTQTAGHAFTQVEPHIRLFHHKELCYIKRKGLKKMLTCFQM